MKIIRENTSFIITDFKWEKQYDYPQYTRQEEHGARTYNVGELKVPSVTTILSATQSEDKKASLDAWRERIGYENARLQTLQAATRGTEMHYVLENYINKIAYLNLSSKGAEARMMAHAIINHILGPLKVIYGSEVSLRYENKWAGSTDLIGLYDEKPYIVDFKQSNKPKKEEWIEDYYYQIAAYSLAHKKHFGPIQGGLIAMCTPNLVWQRFEMDQNKLSEYEDKWFARVEKYYKMHE